MTKYKYSDIHQMLKKKAFAKLTNANCAAFISMLLQESGCHFLSDVEKPYFTSLCNSVFPLESSPFFFLEEYLSIVALQGLPGPTGPEPGTCGCTVGEGALLCGDDFSGGT